VVFIKPVLLARAAKTGPLSPKNLAEMALGCQPFLLPSIQPPPSQIFANSGGPQGDYQVRWVQEAGPAIFIAATVLICRTDEKRNQARADACQKYAEAVLSVAYRWRTIAIASTSWLQPPAHPVMQVADCLSFGGDHRLEANLNCSCPKGSRWCNSLRWLPVHLRLHQLPSPTFSPTRKARWVEGKASPSGPVGVGGKGNEVNGPVDPEHAASIALPQPGFPCKGQDQQRGRSETKAVNSVLPEPQEVGPLPLNNICTQTAMLAGEEPTRRS